MVVFNTRNCLKKQNIFILPSTTAYNHAQKARSTYLFSAFQAEAFQAALAVQNACFFAYTLAVGYSQEYC